MPKDILRTKTKTKEKSLLNLYLIISEEYPKSWFEIYNCPGEKWQNLGKPLLFKISPNLKKVNFSCQRAFLELNKFL